MNVRRRRHNRTSLRCQPLSIESDRAKDSDQPLATSRFPPLLIGSFTWMSAKCKFQVLGRTLRLSPRHQDEPLLTVHQLLHSPAPGPSGTDPLPSLGRPPYAPRFGEDLRHLVGEAQTSGGSWLLRVVSAGLSRPVRWLPQYVPADAA